MYHSSVKAHVLGIKAVETSRLLIVSTVPPRLGAWSKKFAPPSRPSYHVHGYSAPKARAQADYPMCGAGEDARIVYMTTLSLAEARANLSKLVESAVTTHERFEVTRNGDRAAVLLSADDYDALLETVDVLSRPEQVEAIRRGLDDLESGETSTADDVRAALIAAGRITE